MSKESWELRDLENQEAAKLVFGDTVIEKATGNVGTVTELDNEGRPYKVTFRGGGKGWFEDRELYQI